MSDPTPIKDQNTEEEERLPEPEDLDVEPDDAAQVSGGFTPVPIPKPH